MESRRQADPVAKLIAQAAVDVAAERLTRLHPTSQVFVFGAEGEPFWARWAPFPAELETLRRALVLLEEQAGREAPLTVRGAAGDFSALVLDAERTLFAVVLMASSPRLPAETRPTRRAPPELTSWRG